MDIIFFAAIAFYIFFKLNKQLGKIDEEEKSQIQIKIAQKRDELASIQQQILADQKQQKEKIVGAKSTTDEVKNSAEEKILATLNEATKENLIPILQRCKISAEFFLNGAKSAFEMVIKAFSGADLTTLKFLLSEKIYQGFEAAVNQRKSAEQTLITNLISIEKAEIISAMTFENFASIAVKFSSKQINYITNKDGQIIEGKKDEISEITDVWTFKKDLTSSNPNWAISSTS
jgi:predicted lipid-binding transport protein (Tim44 family)